MAASGASEVEWDTTYLTSTYSAYFIKLTDIQRSADGYMGMQWKQSGSYVTSGYCYVCYRVNAENGATGQANGGSGTTYIRLDQENLESDANYNANWNMWLSNPAGTSNYKMIDYTGSGHNVNPDLSSFWGVGDNQSSAAALEAIKFYPESGTFSGTFSLYGLTK